MSELLFFPSLFGAGASGFPGDLQKRGKAVVMYIFRRQGKSTFYILFVTFLL